MISQLRLLKQEGMSKFVVLSAGAHQQQTEAADTLRICCAGFDADVDLSTDVDRVGRRAFGRSLFSAP